MSKVVVQSDVEDVLSSIRQLVGETKQSSTFVFCQDAKERLVLEPQQRVAKAPVLRLLPEQAVEPEETWGKFEEPPLAEISCEPRTTKDPDGDDEPTFNAPADDGSAHRLQFQKNVSDLTSKIEALEKAIAKTADQWEPDGAGQDAYSGTQPPTIRWRENVELDGLGKPMIPPVTPEPKPDVHIQTSAPNVQDDIEEQFIEEDALRIIVAEIVRSEFQGELGERITRNVRKLVRREIQRALTARTYD